MNENFQTERSTLVHLSKNKCPFANGAITPYHNKRFNTSLDPDTLGANAVGTSAGTVREGGTYPLDERGFIQHRTSHRGNDVNTNSGIETFQNYSNTPPGYNQVYNNNPVLRSIIDNT